MEGSVTKRVRGFVGSDLYEDSLLVVSNYDYVPQKANYVPKLAIFDLDDTLICTESGRGFAKSIDDWRFLYPEVPGRLKQLCQDGYVVFVVTNQLGVSKGFISVDALKEKLDLISAKLGIPIYILAATKGDEYRKPCIGAFEYIITQILFERFAGSSNNDCATIGSWPLKRISSNTTLANYGRSKSSDFSSSLRRANEPAHRKGLSKAKSISNSSKKPKKSNSPKNNFFVDLSKKDAFGLRANIHRQSFFCGDAAGREEPAQRDFSNTDLLFALNCGLNFYLPEQFFLGKKIRPLPLVPQFKFGHLITATPQDLLKTHTSADQLQGKGSSTVIILTGAPGCGKTTLAQQFFPKFTILSYAL